MNKVCCFTGHRKVERDLNEVRKITRDIIESLINEGVIYFYSGGAFGFDLLAANEVLKLKAKFPEIRLCLALPCLPSEQTRMWNKEQRDLYMDTLAQADRTVILDKFYTSHCMFTRDRYMVDHSDICIAYKEFHHNQGGTAYTIDYAHRKNKKIFNIVDHFEKG